MYFSHRVVKMLNALESSGFPLAGLADTKGKTVKNREIQLFTQSNRLSFDEAEHYCAADSARRLQRRGQGNRQRQG